MSVDFTVLDITPEEYAASPVLLARLRIESPGPDPVHALALRVQVRIEPGRRSHTQEEGLALTDLFGTRDRWATTVHPFVWMHCATMVQGFTGTTEVDLPMPCTYDFDVTASKYLNVLGEGAVPLIFLFSGTVFTRGLTGFGVEQIPWDRECRFDLPVSTWRALVDEHFHGVGWVRVEDETLAALTAYKAGRGLMSHSAALQELLDHAREVAS